MPQEDNEAAELDHSEEVELMVFPARDQSAEVVKPGKEALNLPAAAVAPQFATILRGFSRTVAAARIARLYKSALSANPQQRLSALPSMLETRRRRARVDSFEERSIGELTRERKSEGHGEK